MRKRSNRKNRFKVRAVKRFTKGVALFALTTLLLLTSFTIGASASENEVHWNDDKTVSVLVSRNLMQENNDIETNQLNLSFEITSYDSIEIDGVSLFNNQLSQTGDRYDYVVGENGEYKFSVRTTRYETIIKENGESVQCVRHETFNFTVNVFEIESQQSDDLINNPQSTVIESDTESHETESDDATSDNPPQIKDLVKSIEIDRTQITSIPNGTIVRTLDRIPDKDEILDLLAEDEYVYYKQETNTVYVVKDNNVAQQRSAAYASASVTTGEVLSSGVSFYWKENASYYWEDIAFTEIFVNGIRSYCIEPTILNVSTGSANSTALSEIGLIRVMDGVLYTSLTYAKEKSIEQVVNYGDKYPGHQTLGFSWATTAEVYDRVGWGFYTYGTVNPQTEIDEINRLIGLHSTKPSWDNTTQNVLPNEVVTLTDSSLQYFDVDSRSSGIEVVSKTGNNLQVRIKADNAELVLKKKQGSANGTSYVYTDGTSQRVGTFALGDPVWATKNFKYSLGRFELVKTNNHGEILESVMFNLSYNADMSNPFKTIITSVDGITWANDLEAGKKVYYQETFTYVGHVLDNTIYSFTPIAGETVKHTMVNQAIEGRAKLIKTDGSTKLLEGAVFGLYKKDGTLISEITTDANGEIITPKLRYGNYYFKEHQAPWGYITDQTPIPFSIKNHEEVIHLTMSNSLIQVKVKGLKTDAEDGTPLQNAEFKIMNQGTGEWVTIEYQEGTGVVTKDTWVSNEMGEFLMEASLSAGQYQLVETKAPEGYRLAEPISFTIDENTTVITLPIIGNVLEISVPNDRIKGHIEIGKVDAITGNPLIASFNLYDAEKNYIGEFTTEELTGKVLIENLVYGGYFIEEIWVQEPYVVNPLNKIQYVQISEHDTTYSVEFANDKTTGEYIINKHDAKNDARIQGVEYGIYDVTDLIVNDDSTITYKDVKGLVALETKLTDELGVITFNTLDISRKWAVIELSAPYGYVVDESVNLVEFEYVDCDTPLLTQEVKLLNERLKVLIRGEKRDFDTNELIPTDDFVLDLKDSNGNIIKYTLFKDGIYTWEVDALELYELSESDAPFGYQLSDEVILIDTSIRENDNIYTIKYFNSLLPDDALPVTGINNTPFLIGMMITLLGGLLLMIRKRKTNVVGSTTQMSKKFEIARNSVKTVAIFATSAIVLSATEITANADIIDDLTSVWTSSTKNIGRLIGLFGTIITSLGLAGLVITLFVMLVFFGMSRRRGEDTSEKLKPIAMVCVGIGITLALSVFGWASLI